MDSNNGYEHNNNNGNDGYGLNHSEMYSREYLASLPAVNPFQPSRPLTNEEEEEKALIRNINYLFYLIDQAYNNNNKLIKVSSYQESQREDYENNKQTDFGEKLKETLKSITSSCNKYIDKLFGNFESFGHTILSSSAYGCNGAYIYGNGVSKINKLYKYLKETDIKFKESKFSISNISELADFKKELKENLRSYLSQICQDKEKRVIINNIAIPKGNDTPHFDVLKHQPEWVTSNPGREYSLEYNKYNNGGNIKITRTSKKEILGKERCIYKKSGDRKQYVKHKGDLITITEYKKIMTAKNKNKTYKHLI
jgi:hypothetical protein